MVTLHSLLHLLLPGFFLLLTNEEMIDYSQIQISDSIPQKVKSTGYSQHSFDVKFYKIDLVASDSSIFISGSTSILAEVVTQQIDKIALELVDNYTIDSVLTDNVQSVFQHQSDSILIHLPRLYSKTENLEITVFYHGKAIHTGSTTGIYNREVSKYQKRYTWTLSEPFSAKSWFPCKQDLTDKADSVYVFITTDSHLKAGSNGILENIVYLENDMVRYEWKSRHPITYYLISFALGDYLEYSFYAPVSDGDSIFIQNYIYNDSSYYNENKSKIDATTELIVLFTELFGEYPFADEKYGHCVVPMGGAMEHQTMTTISDFSFNLVAHELAHQWFGNYVTCSTWQHIWINEGFASYAEYLALEHIESKANADNWMAETHRIVKNSSDGSVYVPLDDALNERRIFNYALSYKKGAAIIHMIRQELGDDNLFFKTLRDFLSIHQHGNAGAEDFKRALESNTGKNFDVFFQQWYYGEGYPKLTINWTAGKDSLFIFSLQETTSSITPVFNTLMEFSVQWPGGRDTLISFRQQNNFQVYQAKIPHAIQGLMFDPNRWLLADLDSFIRITDRLNPKSLFSIAPNPVTDKLSIWFKTDPGLYHYYLVNMSGGIINSFGSSESHLEVDMKTLNDGTYMLIILLDNRLHSTKIIKIIPK